MPEISPNSDPEVLDGRDDERSLLAENDQLRASLDKSERVVARLAGIRLENEDKIKDLEDELARARREIGSLKSAGNKDCERCRSPEAERGKTSTLVKDLGARLKPKKQHLKEAPQAQDEASLQDLRRELADAKNLANIRGKRLLENQASYAKADRLSISEVAEKVTNLNEEIFQAAGLLRESLVFQPPEVSDPLNPTDYRRAERILGPYLTRMLDQQTRKVDPALAQVVLQVVLVSYCAKLIRSWCPADAEKGEFLSRIYERIRSTEEQGISGRWRALTRSCLRPAADQWYKDLQQILSSILRTASWMPRSESEVEAFEQKLRPVFKAVEDLRNAIGEEFTSADLDVTVMVNGQHFRPEYMEDAYGNSKRGPLSKNAPPEIVIGTTGFGLRKVLKDPSTGALQVVNVVSAKVAFESTLIEALTPPLPKHNRKKNPN